MKYEPASSSTQLSAIVATASDKNPGFAAVAILTHWLTAIFGGYDKARIWHFWLMVFFILFVVPHVVLVFADGWDTLRSMIVGWSARAERLGGF